MKYFNRLLYLLLIIGFVAGCDNQLSTSPHDSIPANQAYESVNDLISGARGVYGTISGQNIYRINALMADNVRIASGNTGQGATVYNHEVTADIGGSDPLPDVIWNNAYGSIDPINRVLEASREITPEDSANGAKIINRIQGEMYGLRAYEHFDLYRVFSNYKESGVAVPYITQSLPVDAQPSRDTKDDFFNKLISDIDSSITLLKQNSIKKDTVFNIRTAQGLRARIALYRKNWSTATEYASKAIDRSSGLTPRDEYQGIWADSLEGEVMFKLLHPTPSSGTIDIFERASNSDIFYYASNELSDLYAEQDTNDIRFPAFLHRIDDETVEVTKYNKRSGQKNTADIKMMRVSEMYLIRAEANAHLKNLGAAEDDIQELRANRYKNPPPTSFSNMDDALDTIMLERRLELPFEGHRFFDLKRTNKPVTRIPADVNVNGKTTSDHLDADSYMFVFPIPAAEIRANDNIEQNPGY